jgi:DNA-directed RNA polymerase sigma subunit (sigma70/sigma32)
MYRLRTEEYLTLRQVGERFNIGPERVRQIVRRYCHQTGQPYPSRPKHPAS